jgi:Leucine-rich repeat (LRR) protein
MKNSQNKITRKYDDYILVLKSGSSEQKQAIKSGEAVFTLNKFITEEKIIFNYYIENHGDIKGKIEEHLTISYDLSYDTTKCDDLDQKECKAILDFANHANYKIKENKICELNNIICYPLGDKKTIVSVDWNSSDLDGVIHKSIGQLVNLNYLDLSNNKLRKKIPKTINSLTNLRLLLLNNNKLSGKIPDLRNLKYLSYLIINSNQFEGEIPNWISELINLKIIAFSNNKFSGNIPNIKKLVNLKYIFFNQNQFEGPIFGLSSLNNLEAIGIDMEQLDVNIGSIPNLGEKDFF